MSATEISWPAVRAFTKVWNPIAERLEIGAYADSQFDGGEWSDALSANLLQEMHALILSRVSRSLGMRSELLHDMCRSAEYVHYDRCMSAQFAKSKGWKTKVITFGHFPTILHAIRLLCADNNIEVSSTLAKTEVPAKWRRYFEHGEEAAAFIKGQQLCMILGANTIELLEADGNEDALEAFTNGEVSIADHVMAAVNYGDFLDRVLNAAFDGELTALVHAK